MHYSAAYWREQLKLESHVEGGSFRETYRSEWVLDLATLPAGMNGSRNASTCIYFLLEEGQFSAFHRIAADEIWHFYDGHTLTIYEIAPGGKLLAHKLGRDVSNGESLQVIIPAGNWFAARVEAPGEYALAGCTVAPGFDFADFELAEKAPLQAAYPDHAVLIDTLTR